MSRFRITPAAPSPATASDGFPRYLQLQANGTDLGEPDVDTINFASNLTATRGTGENANKVTVAAAAAGGGSETGSLVVRLIGAANGAFNTGTVMARPRQILVR